MATLLRAISMCLLAAIVILGMGWLYIALVAQSRCPLYPYRDGGACNAWLAVWLTAPFGIPLLLAASVIQIGAVRKLVRPPRDGEHGRE